MAKSWAALDKWVKNPSLLNKQSLLRKKFREHQHVSHLRFSEGSETVTCSCRITINKRSQPHPCTKSLQLVLFTHPTFSARLTISRLLVTAQTFACVRVADFGLSEGTVALTCCREERHRNKNQDWILYRTLGNKSTGNTMQKETAWCIPRVGDIDPQCSVGEKALSGDEDHNWGKLWIHPYVFHRRVLPWQDRGEEDHSPLCRHSIVSPCRSGVQKPWSHLKRRRSVYL